MTTRWQKNPRKVVPATARPVRLVYALLVRVGYTPPADLPVRWKSLLNRMSDFRRWVEMGPNRDEIELTEDDWLAMITGELVAIAGRPL